MRLVLLGPPGGGKGTQAVRLAEAFRVPHISTGDLFRAEMAQETELGKLAKSYISRGDLVPDAVVNDMVRGRLSQPDCEGFILDGVPRTSEQALVLEELLKELQRPITVVINLQVPDEVIVERASGRQVCNKCGAIYHVTAKPPKTPGVCDVCSGVLSVRADDQPETVRHRLKVYHSATAPVVEFYAERGLLQTVDGVGDPEEIFSRICAKAEKACYN
jgi:adenylate kinase